MLQSIAYYNEIVTGLFLIALALIVHANGGIWAALIFKVIPFILGCLCVLDFLFRAGLIIIK